MFPPPENKSDSGREQARAKATVEPGDERVRHLWNAPKRDSQCNHEGNDNVAVNAECLKDGCPGLGHALDALCVLPDDAREHDIESNEDQHR